LLLLLFIFFQTCHAETQTQGDLNVMVEIPLAKVDSCNQAEVKVWLALIVSFVESSFDAVCFQAFHAETQTQGDLNDVVKTPLTRVDKSNQAEVKVWLVLIVYQGGSVTIFDCAFSFNAFFCFQMCPVELIEEPKFESLPLENNRRQCLSWFSLVALGCTIFFVLLFASTLLCTGAILQIVSDSGIMHYPYSGQTPEFVKKIIQPFVEINLHGPKGEVIPI